MHALAEEKLKAASAEGENAGAAQIQPLPIRYHMWLYQS
jgi:hypothetical protein